MRRIVDVFPVCEAAPVLSWTSRVMLGCVLRPGGRMCISVCVGHGGECTCCGQWEHWWRATHVKFMFCAAFTKGPRNGFWGKIMPRQPEDQAEDNEAEKGNGESERYWGGKMNESLRRGNEKSKDYPSGQSKGLSEVKLRFPNLFGARPSTREIRTVCYQAWAALQTKCLGFFKVRKFIKWSRSLTYFPLHFSFASLKTENLMSQNVRGKEWLCIKHVQI